MLAWLVEGHRLQHHPARGTRTASPIQNASEHSHGNEEDGRPHTHAKITIKDSRAKIERTVASCRACQSTNASDHGSNPGTRLRGDCPGAYWEVDFTEVKSGKYGYRYSLVFVDTFSGWTEAFPTKHETAQIVTKKLLEDNLPRYGFPVRIGSDNGPGFVSR